jgi:REP element-mobilizing transposase RayT
MSRASTQPVQTEMAFRQLDKNGQLRGGPRPGAGRKRGERPRVAHGKRPKLVERDPQHVTLRVSGELGRLRRLDMYNAVRRALRVVLRRRDEFRIVHISVQNTHLHLLIEASGKLALGNGLRAFEISAAKHFNAVWSKRRRCQQRRRGSVFTDRYHAEQLGSPRQVRNALAYVLNNWRRHGDDRGPYLAFDGRLDPYASGMVFDGWSEATPREAPLPRDYGPPEVSPPRSWLLGHSAALARPISLFEVPGPRRSRRSTEA